MNEDIGYVSSPDELVIYPWTFEAIRLLNQAGLPAIVVTNQSGVARGLYSEATLDLIHKRLSNHLARDEARLDAIYYCPHHPSAGKDPYRRECVCRKPHPGMLHAAVRDLDIDLSRSYVIGDKASDMNLATNAGATGVMVMTGYGRETLENRDQWPCKPSMIADDLLAAVKLIVGYHSKRD